MRSSSKGTVSWCLSFGYCSTQERCHATGAIDSHIAQLSCRGCPVGANEYSWSSAWSTHPRRPLLMTRVAAARCSALSLKWRWAPFSYWNRLPTSIAPPRPLQTQAPGLYWPSVEGIFPHCLFLWLMWINVGFNPSRTSWCSDCPWAQWGATQYVGVETWVVRSCWPCGRTFSGKFGEWWVIGDSWWIGRTIKFYSRGGYFWWAARR